MNRTLNPRTMPCIFCQHYDLSTDVISVQYALRCCEKVLLKVDPGQCHEEGCIEPSYRALIKPHLPAAHKPAYSSSKCPCRVVMTPHIAGVTELSYRNMAQVVAQEVRRSLKGLPPTVQLNSIRKAVPDAL